VSEDLPTEEGPIVEESAMKLLGPDPDEMAARLEGVYVDEGVQGWENFSSDGLSKLKSLMALAPQSGLPATSPAVVADLATKYALYEAELAKNPALTSADAAALKDSIMGETSK